MDDDKIKGLFQGFQPEFSSDMDFMSRLQRSMDAVESVRRQNLALQKRNKLAVAIAALSGFVLGVIMTLLFPIISNWMTTIHFTLPSLQIAAIDIEPSHIGMLAMAAVCVILTLNIYELALAKLNPNRTLV